jgi:hypothetical protein
MLIKTGILFYSQVISLVLILINNTIHFTGINTGIVPRRERTKQAKRNIETKSREN